MNEMKIERVADGVATPVSLPYTVESKLAIPQEALKTMLMEMLHTRGFAVSGSNLDQRYFVGNFGYSSPLFTGGLVLSNEPEATPDDEGASWDVAIKKTNDPRFVCGADIMNTYSGSDSTRGTINKAESYYQETPQKLHAHLVFDFPTHSANSEFNTVTFTPRALYYTPNDQSLGVEGLCDSFLSYSDKMSHYISPEKTYYTDTMGFIPTSRNYGRMAFGGDGSFLYAYRRQIYMNTLDNGFKKVVFDKQKYNEFPVGNTDTEATHTPAFINGKFYVFYTGYSNPIQSANGGVPYVEVTGVQIGGNGDYYLTTSAEKVLPIPSDFISNASSSVRTTFNIISIIQQGQNFALILSPKGSSGTSGYNYGGFILYDPNFNVLKYSKTHTQVVISSSNNGYFGMGVPLSHHKYGENVLVYNDPHDVSSAFKVDMGNGTGMYSSDKLTDKKLPFTKYSTCTGCYSTTFFPACDPLDDEKVYYLMWGKPTGNSAKRHISTPAFTDYVLRFKLNSPMQKTADEVMKLTFDITVEI